MNFYLCLNKLSISSLAEKSEYRFKKRKTCVYKKKKIIFLFFKHILDVAVYICLVRNVAEIKRCAEL